VHKQIIGYVPANLVPAIISFAMIYAYTRLLTPAAFGTYSYVFSVVTVLQVSVFNAIPVGVMRFHPAAVAREREIAFLREAYTLFYAITSVIIAVAVVILWWAPLPAAEAGVAWFGLPLLAVRAAIGINQAVNRSTERMARYNTIECAHACLGFGFGLLFIHLRGPDAESVVLGLLVAAVVCAAADVHKLTVPLRHWSHRIERASVWRLARFAWPLMAAALTASLLQVSDRFVVGGLGSTEMLGLYTVAYSLVERPMTLICTSISIATFSIAVKALEQRGRQAGRIQAGKNGAVLIALMLPACVGLALTSPYIAAVLVGPAYKAGVAVLIPIMSVTALCRGLRSHFIDHSYHLSGRPNLMLLTFVPATIVNVGLNLVLVPRYGMLGAAWAGLGCQIGAAALSWVIGQRVFPLWLPAGAVARVFAAVAPMAVVLWLVRFPLNWLGLLGAITLGSVVFGAAALLLDVGGMRSMLRLPQRLRPAERVL
jgi:O-antigen/teichoic acid export membrane protein